MIRFSDRAPTQIVLQRMVFAVGIVWGFFPLISVPLILMNSNEGSSVARAALVLNGLTTLPACLLAFWMRGFAALWLGLNAIAMVAYAIRTMPQVVQSTLEKGLVAFALLLGVFAVFAHLSKWPLPLQRNSD